MKRMTIERKLACLKRVKTLINKGWCQDVYAMNAYGGYEGTRSAEACKWCLAGAIRRAVSDVIEDATDYRCHPVRSITEEVQQFTSYDIVQWNDADGRTKAQVKRVVQSSIDKLEKEHAKRKRRAGAGTSTTKAQTNRVRRIRRAARPSR